MCVLGQHNLVTWQRWGGILPQLPAGSLLNSLGFVCFHAHVYNESIFALCLLDCFVWGGVMHVFISALHINLGFIPCLRNDTVRMHSLLKLKYLFTSMSSFMYIHSSRWALWHILTFSWSLWLFILTFHLFCSTGSCRTHSFCCCTFTHIFIHTDALASLWPWGLHRTICVGFLQLDFPFSYTLWLCDNLWWPC